MATAFTANQQTVSSFYLSYYGRPADPAGLAYWAAQLDKAGGNLDSIVSSFASSAESTARFSALTPAQHITSLYQELLGRAPEAAGAAYWLGEVTAGRMTIAQLAINVHAGAQGIDVTTVDVRQALADQFTAALPANGAGYTGLAAVEAARLVIQAANASTSAADVASLATVGVTLAASATANPAVITALTGANGHLVDLLTTTAGAANPLALVNLVNTIVTTAAGNVASLTTLLGTGTLKAVVTALPPGTTLTSLDTTIAGSGLAAGGAVVNPPVTPPGGGDTGSGGTTTPTPTFGLTEANNKVSFTDAGAAITVAVTGGKLVFTSGTTNKTTATDATAITEIEVAAGKTLSGAADVLKGIAITGAGNTTITGAAGDQALNIQTTGTNTIAGGKGVDAITLGTATGTDTIKVVAGTAAVKQKDTLTLSGVYEAGDTVTVKGVADADVVYTVLAGDLGGDAAADLVAVAAKLTTAINGATGAKVAATATANGALTIEANQAGTAFTATIAAANAIGADNTQGAGIATTTPNAVGSATGQDGTQAAARQTTTANVAGGADTQTASGNTTTANKAGTAAGTDTSQAAEKGTTTPNVAAGTDSQVAARTEGVANKVAVAAGATDTQSAVRTDKTVNVVAGTAGQAAANQTTTPNQGVDAQVADLGRQTRPADEDVAQMDTLTLSGTYEVGGKVIVTVGVYSAEYIVLAEDTSLAAIAIKVAAAVNEVTTVKDVVTAAVSGNGLTLTAKADNTPFTADAVAINVTPVPQVDTLTLTGIYEAGDTVTVTGVADADVTYTVLASDVTGDNAANLVMIAGKVVAAINGATGVKVAAAATTEGALTLTANTAGTPFTAAVTTGNREAVAQVDTLTISGTYEAGDVVTVTGVADGTVTYTVLADDIDGGGSSAAAHIAIAAKVLTAINIASNPKVTAAAPSTPDGTLTLTAQTAGTPFTAEVSATNLAAIPAEAQQDILTLTGTYEAGDTVTVTVNGTDLVYTVPTGGEALSAIASAVASAMSANATVNAVASGDAVTLTAKTAGTPFTANVAAANKAAVAQVETLTLTNVYEAGDTVTVTGVATADVVYTVLAEDTTLAAIATKVAAAVNAAAGNTAVTAAATTGGALTLTAKVAGIGFTATVAAANSAEVPAVAQVDTLTLTGTYEVGDTVTVTVDGTPLVYTVDADRTGLSDLAAAVVSAVNTTFASLVTATALNGVVTLTAKTPGTPFTSTVTAANVAAAAQVDTVVLTNVYEAGDTVTVTGVAGAPVVYTVVADDLLGDAAADLVAIAFKVANAVNAAGGTTVTAVATTGGELTLTAKVAGTGFTATATAANSAGTASTAQVDTLTLTGTYEVGDTVTVKGVATADVVYTVVAGDLVGNASANLEAIATKVALAVNAADGHTVNAIQTTGGALTLTANTAGTPFTATVTAANVVLGADDTQAASSVSTTANAAVVASDSTSTAFDTITGFDVTVDKLDLDTAFATAVTVGAFTVDAGFVTGTGGTTAWLDVFTALAGDASNNSKTVAYVVGNDTYILQNDGIAGLSESDVVIKLAGVEVTNLGAILS